MQVIVSGFPGQSWVMEIIKGLHYRSLMPIVQVMDGGNAPFAMQVTLAG